MSVDTAMRPPGTTRSVTRGQLAWLESELRGWQDAGILDDDQAGRIARLYRADLRFPLARMLLTIGAVFIGIGVIWLVAANIDALTPTTRFCGIAVFWLATLAGAEVLAARVDTDRSSPLVGAVRLMAALAFGGVIFQAAQSLQVPAYEPALVGLWASARSCTRTPCARCSRSSSRSWRERRGSGGRSSRRRRAASPWWSSW